MFLSVTTLLFVSLIILLACYFKTLRDFIKIIIKIRKIPGPSKWSLIHGNIGEIYTTPENIFKVMRQWARSYYPIYKLWIAYSMSANLLQPEDIELVLSNPKHINKSMVYQLLNNWLGSGLLTSSGAKWQHRRKILTPAFHFSILQQFVPTFNEETANLVENLKSECYQPHIAINDHIIQFTLKTIAETAMGTKLRFSSKKEQEYKWAIIEMGHIMLYRVIRPILMSNFAYFFNWRYFKEQKLVRILHRFTGEVITEREANFEEVALPKEQHDVYLGKRRLAMLDLMLLAKNKEGVIDSEGIREEVDTFMFEGHDTTATALNFALMLLACHRNAQERVVQEIVEVLGDLGKKPSYNELQELKFLERCLKETLRLYPSVHFISRKLGEDLTTVSGYALSKNTMVHIHIFDLHHNPDIYPDPEKFDPDRFLPENSLNRHPFAYLPFSAGPRNCIGQKFAMLELKAAICGILAHFILEPVDTPDTIVLISDIIIRTKDKIKIKFLPRAQ